MPNRTSSEEGNLYDKIFKENLEELILPMLKQNWEVEIKSMKRLRNKLQTTTEREADFLSEVIDSQDRKFLLHVEFQTKDESGMVYRMQEYHGIISRKYKLPIRHFVIYFGERPSKMINRLPEAEVFKDFTLLDFKTIDHRDLLLSETGSEIVLAILADFKEKSPEIIIRLILQRLKEVSKSPAELKKYFSQLNVLSRLRNLNQEIAKNVNIMPVTIDIEKDYLYNQGIEKGEDKKAREATINMLKRGVEILFICEVLNLSPEFVQEIKMELGL